MRADRLSLARGGFPLFAPLSFELGAGAYMALYGANGAGKTSLLRAIAGFLRVRAGALTIQGAEDPALATHYLGHRDGLKAQLSVRAHARYWAGLLGRGGEGVDRALARVGLARVADLPARVLSQGQARRLSLVRLLVAPRPLWLLDEPAASLDEAGKGVLAALISSHCAAGGSVIAALHKPLPIEGGQSLRLEPIAP